LVREGNCNANSSRRILQERNITVIVNCASAELKNSFNFEADGITYLNLPLFESPHPVHFHGEPYFQQALTFVSDALSNNKAVLIHCIGGMNRSVTVVASLLLAWTYFLPGHPLRIDVFGPNPTVVAVLKYIKGRRPIAQPNVIYIKQLDSWLARCIQKGGK